MPEFNLGRNANINAILGESSTIYRIVQRWLQKFRSGDESIEDGVYRGRLRSLHTDQLKATIEHIPHDTIRDKSQTLCVSDAIVSRNLLMNVKVKNVKVKKMS